MKVINILSGPGGGKSTTAAALYAEMKMQGYSVELVDEYAKQMVYSGLGDWLLNATDYQVTLTANQLHRLWILKDNVDYVVMDSPLILPAFYVDDTWECYPEFTAFLVKLFHTYDNINFFLHRPARFEKEGRVQNEEESKAIDEKIKSFMFYVAKAPYHEINTDRDVVKNILEKINEFN